ncbi:AMP-binding protein [Gordonia sp. NPDC003424]
MVYTSVVPELVIPETNLAEFVLAEVGARPDATALLDAVTGEKVTYRELDDLSARAATGLVRAGIRVGDPVAVISGNRPSYAIAVYAILRAGAVVCPINPILTPGEIRKLLVLSGATAVIHGCDEALINEAAAGTPVQSVFTFGADSAGTSFSVLYDHPPSRPHIPTSGDDVAVLPFSSGTTGVSKGVMLSHRNLIANLQQLRHACPLSTTDVVCAALPLFHIYGFTVILNSAILTGATVITMPHFDLDGYLRVVAEHGVTLGHLAPPIVLALATAPEVDDYDLSTMTKALSGAAPLDAALARRVAERTGIAVRQGYGMTEAGPGTNTVPLDEFDTVPIDSIGPLLPHTEARVVDPTTSADVEPGTPGELWIRGPQVMLGYLDLPEATAATLVDGWLRTGDIVVYRDGHFFVVDRLKELIKYKGYQVAPAELEGVLLSHPAVIDAAVIGLPDAAAGELPVAYVVLADPASAAIDARSVMEWVSARVAPYKKIRKVEFIDRIPKSASGKILRRELKQSAVARSGA